MNFKITKIGFLKCIINNEMSIKVDKLLFALSDKFYYKTIFWNNEPYFSMKYLHLRIDWNFKIRNIPLWGIFQNASAAVVGSRGGATNPPTSVVAACAGAGAGRPHPPWRATPHTSSHPPKTTP